MACEGKSQQDVAQALNLDYGLIQEDSTSLKADLP